MVVYKDKVSGKWYFVTRVTLPNGKKVQRKRKNFERKKDALLAEQEFISTQQQIKQSFTFKELAYKYMQYSIGRKKETSIYNQNNLITTILIPYFNDVYVNQITPDYIAQFYSETYKQYSNSYMNNIKRHLSAILNHAVNFYGLERNVAKIVSLPKKDEQKKLKYWTVDQFNSFIENVDNVVYRGLFILLFWTGLRKGEALALKYSHIDFKNNLLQVSDNWNGTTITTVKNTPSERLIKLPVHVVSALNDVKQRQKDYFGKIKRTDFIFSYRTLSKPMSPANVNKQLKEYTKLSENEPITVHNFRHSHASLLINNNVSLYTVSRHLGHSDIQTTANIYGHLYPNTESEIQSILNDLQNKS